MKRRVVITGAGVVSSLGDSPAALHAALCAGRSGLSPVELFSTEGLGCPLGGEIKSFDAQKYLGKRNLRPLDRTSRLVTSAAQLALDDSGFTTEMRKREEVGLVLGTMFCSVHTIAEFDRRALEAGPSYASPMDFSNTVINAAAGQTAIVHNLRGINSTVATGSTSGLQALAYAADLISRGRARALLAGGAEEMCFESFYGFERAGLLCSSAQSSDHFPIPFDARRNGLVLGEGAALLMLEEMESARERGAHVLAEIKGYGSAYDFSRGQEEARSVTTIARAIRVALNGAELIADEIDCLSASANGSVRGDQQEAAGIAEALGGQAENLPVTAIKSMLGETLGASGALQVVSLLETMRDGCLPGIHRLEKIPDGFPLRRIKSESQQVDVRHALVNSIGLEGACCSLVLSRSNLESPQV